MSQTLDRGIRILEILSQPERGNGLTVAELAGKLEVGRTIVYRLCATLEAHGLVARGKDGKFLIGLGMTRFSTVVLPRLREAAMPALRELSNLVGATAHLTIVEGDDAIAVLVVEPSWTDFHVAYRTGSRHALTRGAAGKAILEARADRRGVVTTEGELQPGAFGVAASLPDVGGLEGSVGVVSLRPLTLSDVAPAVLAAAVQIGQAIP